jgi:hypothetical protein
VNTNFNLSQKLQAVQHSLRREGSRDGSQLVPVNRIMGKPL